MTASEDGVGEAIRLMAEFAERTGLIADREPRRYLWTDAYAVCNLLGLARATGKDQYTDLAISLIDQVHHVLGRYRDGDSRRGWLGGGAEIERESHPTLGGLRIGKKLPERGPDEAFDERLEWDRDGQYFHYLTKWMHALDQTTRATGDARYNLWARELAATAHRAFTSRPASGGRPRMVWKMSSDLSRPLVPSMGHHDPLDGLVTYTQLRTTAAQRGVEKGPDLAEALSDFESMCQDRDWLTTDPLGLGGLMTDAYRVDQLMRGGAFGDGQLLDDLLSASLDGLSAYQHQRGGELNLPASMRLAFRELGLAIGLRAMELLGERLRRDPSRSPDVRIRAESLARQRPLGGHIESFWRNPIHRQGAAWGDHRDINDVMLATSLAPHGFLVL